MSDATTTPPPGRRPPLLSPQGWRVFLAAVVVFVLVMGADVALELTGHGGSPLASVLTKLVAVVVSGAATFFAARAPGPKQAAIEKRLADSLKPPPQV